MKSKKAIKPKQITAFRKAARKLGSDESEERFDATLKVIAKQKPKDAPKKDGDAD